MLKAIKYKYIVIVELLFTCESMYRLCIELVVSLNPLILDHIICTIHSLDELIILEIPCISDNTL